MKTLKMIMSGILCVLMVLLLAVPTLNVVATDDSDEPDDPDLIFFDDFEDCETDGELPPGWTGGSNEAKLGIETTVAKQGKSLKIQSDNDIPKLHKEFDQPISDGIVKISYDIRKTTSHTYGIVRLSGDDDGANYSQVVFSMERKLMIRESGGSNLVSDLVFLYDLNRWYRVDILLDMDEREAICYIDGEEMLRWSTTQLTSFEKLNIWSQSNGTVNNHFIYIDNVEVRKYNDSLPEEDRMLIFADDFNDNDYETDDTHLRRWTKVEKTGNRSLKSVDNGDPYDKSICLSSLESATSDTLILTKEFIRPITTGHVLVSYETKKTGIATSFVTRFLGQTDAINPAVLQFDSARKIAPLNPITTVSENYETEEWYKVDIYLDMSTCETEYYINDQLIAQGKVTDDIKFPSFTSFRKIQFQAIYGGSCDIYIDNLSIRYFPSVKADISITNKEDGTPVESLFGLTDTDILSVGIEMKNTTGEDQDIKLIYALYSNGKLIDVGLKGFVILGTEATKSDSIDIPATEYSTIDTLKVFAWNENIAPIREPLILDKERHYKVLSLGNSFSRDAQVYLHDIAAADGVSLTTVNLSISGGDLETHWGNIENNSPAYLYGRNGKSVGSDKTVENILRSERWDFITLQQASPKSGQFETYSPYMEDIAKYFKEAQPQAEIIIHQTWAYESGCTYSGFENYEYDQTAMYSAIVAAYNSAAETVGALEDDDTGEYIFPDGLPLRILPSGTAFQNAREDENNQTFDTIFDPDKPNSLSLNSSTDGYHASAYGSYLIGAVWYECLTGNDISNNNFLPTGLNPGLIEILKTAAHNAVEEYGWRDSQDD